MLKKRTALDKRSAQLNKIIRAAALQISENASIDTLAAKAKVSGESIRSSIRRGDFSVGLASALELAVGREYLKREHLCKKLMK